MDTNNTNDTQPSIYDLVASLNNKYIEVNNEYLPSKGFFYKDDFKISYRALTREEIEQFRIDIAHDASNATEDIMLYMSVVKGVIKQCCKFSNEYTYKYLRSVDIVYLFLMIATHTNGDSIIAKVYSNDEIVDIPIDETTFIYFDYSKYTTHHNNDEKYFDFYGYRYTLPSVAVEEALINYYLTTEKSYTDTEILEMNTDFIYFIHNSDNLQNSSIDNMIEIYTHDIPEEEREKISSIVKIFEPIGSYKLKTNDGKEYAFNYINIKNIFK